MTTLIIGEDRELVVDITDAAGAPLLLGGWALELRLGGPNTARLTKPMTISATPGRASVVFIPTDLAAVGVGDASLAVWRVDPGATYLVAEATVRIRKVL